LPAKRVVAIAGIERSPMEQTKPLENKADLNAICNIEPLHGLRSGEVAFICDMRIDPRTAKRLADLGFIGGARIEMIRPGRPCLVRINGTRVGLGWGYQKRVLVDRSTQQ